MSNLTRVFWLGSNKDMVLIPTILQVFIFILHLQWRKFYKSDRPGVKSFWVGSIWPSRSSLYRVSVLGLSAKIWLGVNLDPMSNRADSTVVDNFRFFMPQWKNFTYLPLGGNEFCDVWSCRKLESFLFVKIDFVIGERKKCLDLQVFWNNKIYLELIIKYW